MKICCPSCKKATFNSSLRKCPNCGKEFTDKEIKSRVRATKFMYFSVIFAALTVLLVIFVPKDVETIKDDIIKSENNQTVFKYSDKYTKIKPAYGIVEASDTSVRTAKRMSIKIIFPAGQKLSEEYLQEQLVHAAFTAIIDNKMDAVTVGAYSDGDDYDMGYTIAGCMVAPYGELRRASEKVSKKDLRAVFTLDSLYDVGP